jgi:hypothetical protein
MKRWVQMILLWIAIGLMLIAVYFLLDIIVRVPR